LIGIAAHSSPKHRKDGKIDIQHGRTGNHGTKGGHRNANNHGGDGDISASNVCFCKHPIISFGFNNADDNADIFQYGDHELSEWWRLLPCSVGGLARGHSSSDRSHPRSLLLLLQEIDQDQAERIEEGTQKTDKQICQVLRYGFYLC
jgi:hypothetical protein